MLDGFGVILQNGPNCHNLFRFLWLRGRGGLCVRCLTLAAVVLRRAEVGEGSVPAAFGGGGVAEEPFHHCQGEGVVGHEGPFEGFGLVFPGALEPPPADGEVFDEQGFGLADRLVFGDEAGTEGVERGGIFVFNDEFLGGESVFESVHFRDFAAGLSARAGGALRVRAIRPDLRWCCHKCSSTFSVEGGAFAGVGDERGRIVVSR